jgi:hypothetical protein
MLTATHRNSTACGFCTYVPLLPTVAISDALGDNDRARNMQYFGGPLHSKSDVYINEFKALASVFKGAIVSSAFKDLNLIKDVDLKKSSAGILDMNSYIVRFIINLRLHE